MILAYSLLLLCFVDVLAYACLILGRQKPKSILLNLALINSQLTFRKAVLSLVMKHYTSYDANLGYRMKANTKPFRMLHRLPGNKKRFKEVSIKNFFEFRTDDYGYIANSVGQQRDYAAIAKDSSIYK